MRCFSVFEIEFILLFDFLVSARQCGCMVLFSLSSFIRGCVCLFLHLRYFVLEHIINMYLKSRTQGQTEKLGIQIAKGNYIFCLCLSVYVYVSLSLYLSLCPSLFLLVAVSLLTREIIFSLGFSISLLYSPVVSLSLSLSLFIS